jgi:hypothetical protein
MDTDITQQVTNQEITNQSTETSTIEKSTLQTEEPIIAISDKLITKYRNLTMAFINQHKKDLVSIFLKHSREASDEDRIGVLGINLIDFDTTGKIDIAYLPVRILEAPVAHRIHERINENEIHIIYFLMITPYEEQILELDIRSLMD